MTATTVTDGTLTASVMACDATCMVYAPEHGQILLQAVISALSATAWCVGHLLDAGVGDIHFWGAIWALPVVPPAHRQA